MTLATLPEALDWLETHWEGRAVPFRLWDRGTESLTGAFVAYLQAQPNDASTLQETDTCRHPRLGDEPPRSCPDCYGAGTRTFTRTRYRYPMWSALVQLEKQPALRPHQPSPLECIALLVLTDFEARRAAVLIDFSWDTAEALFLMAIRKLHGRYRTGPIPTRTYGNSVAWKSEAQSMAEASA